MITKEVGIVILAAGQSSRMGTPKQNLVYNNETFLNRNIQTALETSASSLLVVLGAFAEKIEKKDAVNYVINPNWVRGMGSSVALGSKEILQSNSQLSGILLMLCDQPFVTKNLLNRLIESFQKQNEKSIIVCEYDNTVGVPVLFGKKYFEKLQQLNEKTGAQKIIHSHLEDALKIFFPQGKWDIDTPERYQALVNGDLDT